MRHVQIKHIQVLEEIMKQEDYTPKTKADTFISLITPEINRKAAELKRSGKQRREGLLLMAGYVVFVIIAFSLVFDYFVDGFSTMGAHMLSALAVISLISLCCLPLLVKFCGNKQ